MRRLLGLLLLWTCACAAQAATYAFRSDSYAWETAANAISWDRSCTGYPGDDDKATVTFTGGFTFTFAGTAYSSVRVLSNGMLQFGADTGFFRNYANTAMPPVRPRPAAGAWPPQRHAC
jgi:MSHA biogenesis protein MshQ